MTFTDTLIFILASSWSGSSYSRRRIVQFNCGDDTYVPYSVVCDQNMNCANGADEVNCAPPCDPEK